MALICKDKFEQRKIDNLLSYLKLYADKGQPIDYEIIMDGFKAVRRTSDLEMFSLYENFVTGDTKYIEILLFAGSSNNNDKRIFYFGEEVKEVHPREGLSGVEVQQLVDEGVRKATREKEFELLEKKNKNLEHEVEELQEEVEELTKQKAALEAKLSPLNSVLGDVGSSMVESFIKRNPAFIASLPGGEALAGLLQQDAADGGQSSAPETPVSFKAATDKGPTEASYQHALTEAEQSSILFVEQLKGQFTKEEFNKVLVILQALADDKSLIDEISSKYGVVSSK